MPSMRKQDEKEDKSNDQKSKWVKTDSECKILSSVSIPSSDRLTGKTFSITSNINIT